MGGGTWSLCCWRPGQVRPLKEVPPPPEGCAQASASVPIQLGDGENPKMPLGRFSQECFPTF